MVLRYLEQKLTFKPTRVDYGGLARFNPHRLRFGHEFGLDLDGAYMDRDSRTTVLFVHGNKHNLTRFEDHYTLFSNLGLSTFCFDYPGYGQSSGTPSEEAVYASARAAYSYLTCQLGRSPQSVIVYGCSMGGAVAIELLQHVAAAALITESTFTNSWEMAQHLYPFLPVWRLLPKRFENDAKIGALRIPLHMIHGDLDRVVPVRMAHALHAIAPPGTSLQIVPGANHVNAVAIGGQALAQTIGNFVGRVTSGTN